MTSPPNDFSHIQNIRPANNFQKPRKYEANAMQPQKSAEHASPGTSLNNWCTTSGSNMAPLPTDRAVTGERSFFVAETAEIVDDPVDVADSDNDFGLTANDEDDIGEGGEVDADDGELHFCQVHAQTFMANQRHHQFAMEAGSVFYDDQLPPIPPGKSSAKAFVDLRTRLDDDQHIVLRGRQQRSSDLLAERSFGFYDGNMPDVEISSLTSSASVSSFARPTPSHPPRQITSSASHRQQMISPYGNKSSNNRLSSVTTSDADGFDSISASSAFSAGASGTARDNVRECLEKEPPERTDDDIEVLLDFIQRLPAFANMTQSVRRALCAAMVFAAVKEVGTIVMHDGEELDSWSVLINGHVEIEYNSNNLTDATDHNAMHTIHRAELHVGDSFGVIEPTMERLYHQGTMRTLCDDCQFVCVEQAKFCAILCQGKEFTSAFEKQGRTVMVIEHRLIDAASQRRGPVVIKATAQQLIEHLMADDVGAVSKSQQKTADPTYVDDFLLAYRIFLDSPLEISQRLMGWFGSTDATLRDKVVRVVLVWINQHFVDFEQHPKLMVFLEEFISSLAADERTTQLRLMNIACSVKARQRMITLTRSRRDETLNFSVLGGAERGCGVFICHVADQCKAMHAGLRRGDQIMKVNGISFDGITHEKALEVLRTATHLAITVQSNLFGFREMIHGGPTPLPLPQKPTTTPSKNSSENKILQQNGDYAVECSEKTGEQQPPLPTNVDAVDNNAYHASSHPAATVNGFDTLNTRRKFVKALMRMNWRNTAAKSGTTPVDTADSVASSSASVLSTTSSSTTTNSNLCCTDALNLEVSAAATSKFYTQCNSPSSVTKDNNNLFFAFNDDNDDSLKTKHENRLSLNTTITHSKKPNGACSGAVGRLYHCLSNPDLRATLAELDKSSTKPDSAGAVGSEKLSKRREEADAVAKQLQTTTAAAAAAAVDVDHHVIKLFLPNQSFKYVAITNKMTARQVIIAGLHEFQLLTTNPSNFGNYSLYQVSVVAGGVTRQRRLADTSQDLAESLPLNARYYLKNNLNCSSSSANLVPDAVAHEIWKDSQVEFLQLNMLEAAAQLTMQDFGVFRKIEPTEYVDELWPVQKRLPYLVRKTAETTTDSAAPAATKTSLSSFTELSNRQMFWVVNEVCRHRDSPARRARVLKNFIKLAQYCFAIRNFNSCFAIVFGLRHAAVSRLKASWERVPHKHVKQLKALESLMDPSRNMSKYRQLLARYQHSPPLIPFYPIVKKDLTFLNEGNTTFETIQQQQQQNSETRSDDAGGGGENDLLFLVNFEKLRMFAREIRQLKHYASVAYNVDDILSSTYFADIIDASGGVTAPLLRRRTRPDAAVHMPTTNENLTSRQLVLPANKAKQLLALNLAGSFKTSSVVSSEQSEMSSDLIAVAATPASSSDVSSKNHTSLFSRSTATTILSPSLKKLYENRQMMRRVKLYLSELEIVQNEEQLHALSHVCEPAAGGSAAASASSSTALKADAAKLKAATLNSKQPVFCGAETLKISTKPTTAPLSASSSKPLAPANKHPTAARNTTVSFVRSRPNSNKAAPLHRTAVAAGSTSLPRALQHSIPAEANNTAVTREQNSLKLNNSRNMQQPQQSNKAPAAPTAVVGLPKFGQQSPHAVQKLLSLAEKKGAPRSSHHMPKFSANAARFHHFNAVQSSSYYSGMTPAAAAAFPIDLSSYSSSASGNVGGVNYVYGGPPPNSQRLLPALRRNLPAVANDNKNFMHNNNKSISSHLSGSSSSSVTAVPLSPSFAANDENAYHRYHFTPAVVQCSGSVVSSSNSSSTTSAGAAAAHDLRAHPVQVTTVVDHRRTTTTAANSKQQQQQQYRLSEQYEPLPIAQRQQVRNNNNRIQPPRPPPIEPCNTSLTSQESVPDSGFAVHVSGSGSVHSALSDFCGGARAHRSHHATAATTVTADDSSFSPSIDEGLNNCSLSDNSPGSFTRRQQPKQQQEHIEAEFVQHATKVRERGGGGGDGTLTNSNRRERSSRTVSSNNNMFQHQTVVSSANVAGGDAPQDEQAMFALSRC